MSFLMQHDETGELAPAHRIGVDEDGRELFAMPEGWAPTVPYELNEDGLAYRVESETYP